MNEIPAWVQDLTPIFVVVAVAGLVSMLYWRWIIPAQRLEDERERQALIRFHLQQEANLRMLLDLVRSPRRRKRRAPAVVRRARSRAR